MQDQAQKKAEIAKLAQPFILNFCRLPLDCKGMKKDNWKNAFIYSLPDPEKLSKDPSAVVVAISLLLIGSVLTRSINKIYSTYT